MSEVELAQPVKMNPETSAMNPAADVFFMMNSPFENCFCGGEEPRAVLLKTTIASIWEKSRMICRRRMKKLKRDHRMMVPLHFNTDPGYCRRNSFFLRGLLSCGRVFFLFLHLISGITAEA